MKPLEQPEVPPEYVQYPRDPKYLPIGQAGKLALLKKGLVAWEIAWIVGLFLKLPWVILREPTPGTNLVLWRVIAWAATAVVLALDFRAYRLLAMGFGKERKLGDLVAIVSTLLRVLLLMVPLHRSLAFGLYSLVFLFLSRMVRRFVRQRFRPHGVEDFEHAGKGAIPEAIQAAQDMGTGPAVVRESS